METSVAAGKKMKYVLLLLITTLLFMPTLASADYFVPQGAPQPVAQLVLNKQVKNPQNGLFVENLTVTDAHFLPGQEITFRVELRNTGGNELKGINVKDKLPDFVDFVSGPGSFDSNTKTLNSVIDVLGPGESKTFEIKAKIRPEADLPKNQLTCVTNLAQASVGQIFTQDTAVFCIEAQVLGITRELPVTGPDNIGLTALISTLSLAVSIFLFKLSKDRR